MGLLQPIDGGANRGYAGFDAAMIGINYRWRSASLTFRIIKKTADVGMQRRLVGFQSQGIVAALSTIWRAIARWQFSASTVTMVSFSESIASSLGTAVISLDFASVAI